MSLKVQFVGDGAAAEFVYRHHYAKTMPAITKVCLGLFDGSRLAGVMSWGYGTRPLHTIAALFPSLTSEDYMELGRLCVHDDYARNTESWFMARSVELLRQHSSGVKLLFSWADGMRGKPGYIYQACSWLYGGFIWTDTYLTDKGEIVHPRLYQTQMQEGRKDGLKCGKQPRPTSAELRRCEGLRPARHDGSPVDPHRVRKAPGLRR